MYQVIIVFHVLFGLAIIGLVLMQQGKGADAGAAFGAGASGTVFGAQGAASFLSRTTAIFATLFFSTSLGLAIYNSHSGVAYDLMSDKSVEQESLKIPEDNGSKNGGNVQVPAIKTAEKPAVAVPEEVDKSDESTEKGKGEVENETESPVSKKVDPPAKIVSQPAEEETDDSAKVTEKLAPETSGKKGATK